MYKAIKRNTINGHLVEAGEVVKNIKERFYKSELGEDVLLKMMLDSGCYEDAKEEIEKIEVLKQEIRKEIEEEIKVKTRRTKK